MSAEIERAVAAAQLTLENSLKWRILANMYEVPVHFLEHAEYNLKIAIIVLRNDWLDKDADLKYSECIDSISNKKMVGT